MKWLTRHRYSFLDFFIAMIVGGLVAEDKILAALIVIVVGSFISVLIEDLIAPELQNQ